MPVEPLKGPIKPSRRREAQEGYKRKEPPRHEKGGESESQINKGLSRYLASRALAMRGGIESI